MARFGTALILAAAAPTITAFCPHPHFRVTRGLSAVFNEDIDDFDAPMPANPQKGVGVLDHEIVVVDDEC